MDIRVLRYFLAVAREESISGTAESLHLSQPTLSRQLSDLEKEIGKTLFIRGSRRITLTEHGTLLRKRAGEIIDLMEKTTKELTASVVCQFFANSKNECPIFLAKLGCEDFVVHGEDDNHSYASGGHSGNDALDGVSQSLVCNQCDGNGVPDAGEQGSSPETPQQWPGSAARVGEPGAVTLKGHIALEREIDTFPKENGG